MADMIPSERIGYVAINNSYISGLQDPGDELLDTLAEEAVADGLELD